MAELFAQMLTSAGLLSLLSLTTLEIVLGIDNIVFISIICGRLHPKHQEIARRVGLILAMGVRITLLFALQWILGLKEDLFTLPSLGFDVPHESLGISGKDLILLLGGLFLIYKSTHEIHQKLEGHEEDAKANKTHLTFSAAVMQIVLIDIVFSFDSILTAVGLVRNILIMICAVIISSFAMMVFARPVSDFVNRHPTMKMLALSFLVLIGFLLMVEGFHIEVPKGYVYFAMVFAFTVELLNMRMRKKI